MTHTTERHNVTEQEALEALRRIVGDAYKRAPIGSRVEAEAWAALGLVGRVADQVERKA